MMQWSQLKKRIEKLFADSVKGRIELGSIRYRKSHDQDGGRGWIRIDKEEIINMFTDPWYSLDSWDENAFSHEDWHESLFDYLNLAIGKILESENPIIRAMGMLDARVGKRRLKKIDVSKEHDLVKRLYFLRCDAEKLFSLVDLPEGVDLTSRLSQPSIRTESVLDDEEKRQEAIIKLTKAKKTRNLKKLIKAVYEKKLREEDLDTTVSKRIFKEFQKSGDPSLLFQILNSLGLNSKLIHNPLHVRGVLALTRINTQWYRPFEEWEPRSHNPDRQFTSLARHLTAKYDVPVFMDKAWLNGNEIQQQWFRHIGAGGNIRTAKDLPVPLTKNMAHHFMKAPDHYSISAAFRWGQVHALGGDQRLADALLETRLLDDFSDNDFTLSVIRFLIRNPMLDTIHISPIIDYIWNQRYENRIVFVERGVAEEIGPAQPNFSMQGRTVDALLRQVEEWYRQLGREKQGGDLQWKKSNIQEYHFIEGTKRSKNMKIWRIRELLNNQELIAEGKQQKNCVASYAQSCHSGKCSIWTMDMEAEDSVEKLLTIEVLNSDKQIRQVRGKRNRRPTEKEMDILERWAEKEGLEIASYLR